MVDLFMFAFIVLVVFGITFALTSNYYTLKEDKKLSYQNADCDRCENCNFSNKKDNFEEYKRTVAFYSSSLNPNECFEIKAHCPYYKSKLYCQRY